MTNNTKTKENIVFTHQKETKTINKNNIKVDQLIDDIMNDVKKPYSLTLEERTLLLENEALNHTLIENASESFKLKMIENNISSPNLFDSCYSSEVVIIAAINKFGIEQFLNGIKQTAEDFITNNNSSYNIIIALIENDMNKEILSKCKNEDVILYLIKNELISCEKFWINGFKNKEIKKEIIKRSLNKHHISDFVEDPDIALYALKYLSHEQLEELVFEIDNDNISKDAILLGLSIKLFDTTYIDSLINDLSFREKCIEKNILVAEISKKYYKCQKTISLLIKYGFSNNVLCVKKIQDTEYTISVIDQALYILNNDILESIMQTNQEILLEYTGTFSKTQLDIILSELSSKKLLEALNEKYIITFPPKKNNLISI